MNMIQSAFSLLDQEFQKLDRCIFVLVYMKNRNEMSQQVVGPDLYRLLLLRRVKSEVSEAAAALQRENEAHEVHRQQQQQVSAQSSSDLSLLDPT